MPYIWTIYQYVNQDNKMYNNISDILTYSLKILSNQELNEYNLADGTHTVEYNNSLNNFNFIIQIMIMAQFNIDK